MTDRIPPATIDAAFGASAPPPAPPRVKITIESPNHAPQIFEGVSVLAGIALGDVRETTASANWMANVSHESGAVLLASIVSALRDQFGQRCIDAGLELSRSTMHRPLDDASGAT